DWTMIRGGPNPAFLTVVTVEYTDGWSEAYLVPLALVSGPEADRALAEQPSSVLARITGARKGAMVDGLQHEATRDRLLALVEQREEAVTARGRIRGLSIAAQPPPPERKWTRGSGDQSNSVAFLSDRLMLKLIRRIEPGPNPELELGRFLTERRFPRTPALLGALEYFRPSLEPGTLAVVQAVVKHQGSAWEYSIGDLHRYFERVSPRTMAPP